jgi:hypothetical protein
MNPTSDTTADTRYRVFRGGCWNFSGPSWVRAASRDSGVPAYRGSGIGFRCALRGREPRV